jgi:tRNA pseudouridine55 synthase
LTLILQKTNPYEEGRVLLVNKPLHWTSFDVVRKLRNAVRTKKVGHAGTLDPLASGLLILCTGRMTKQINQYMAREKEYTGSFTLGAETPTYDLESEPANFRRYDHISESDLQQAALLFSGEIQQVPPIYSAIKKDGKPAYLLARKGRDVVLEPRPINISAFDVHVEQMPVVRFRVVCSTGTYIRSLANDFGRALGCGAYLSSLCRTRIGEFKLEDAKSVEDWVKEIQEVLQESQNG